MNKLAPSQIDPGLPLTFAELCFVILEIGLGKNGRSGWTFSEIDRVMPARRLGKRAFGAAAVRAWFKGINLPRQSLGEFKEFFLKGEEHHGEWADDIDAAYQHSRQIRSDGEALFQGDSEKAKALLGKYRNLKIGRIQFAAASGLTDYRDIQIEEASVSYRRRVLDRPVTRQSLQAGYYMPRKDVEERISTELEKFILRAESKGAFGVFWIGGRSGDGKSTLLARAPLMLLDRTTTDYVYVDQTSFLEALDFSEPHWSGRRVVLVVNDLFASPADKDIILIRQFVSRCRFALESGFVNGLTIATCGPDPELDLFSQHFSEVDIKHFRTPDPSVDEKKKLATWFGYQDRLEFRESDLLVEFLFCLEVGMSLSQFAVSFRERLNQLPGSFDLVEMVVTSSAFGLSVPISVLGGDRGTEDTISRLSEEDQRHFSFEETEYGNSTLFSHNAISKSLIHYWMVSATTTNKVDQAVFVVCNLFDAIDFEEVFAFRLIERIRLHNYHLSQICREDVAPTTFLKQLAARVKNGTLGWSNVHAGYVSNIALERDREAGVIYLSEFDESEAISAPPGNGEAVLLAKIAEVANFVGPDFVELRERCVERLLSQRLGGVSGYALGHLITRRIASPELAERWMLFFPEAPRPPELICAAAPSDKTIQEARCWLEENGTTQQSAKVAAWIVDHQNTVEEVTGAVGKWLRQPNIHGQFSVVAQILKDFPNCSEIVETSIDWISKNRGFPGTENVVSRLVRTAPLTKDVLLSVTGYIRHQFSSSVSEDSIMKRLEPVLLAIISVWPRRTVPAGKCAHKLVSTIGKSDQALKLHAKNLSMATTPKQLAALHELTLSLIDLNFDEAYLASHLATYVKRFPISPQVKEVVYRWLKKSKCRKAGAGVVSAIAGKTNVTNDQKEKLWEWIHERRDDRDIHNTIWVYLRQFHKDKNVRVNVTGWLNDHEHYFGSIVLRSHVARIIPELSEELGRPKFDTNEAVFDVPSVEFARQRFDYFQDEVSGRALEAAILASPSEAPSINAMSSLLGRSVTGYDPLPGALKFLEANLGNPRIPNLVTKLINDFDLDDENLAQILIWVQSNRYSPGVNIPIQAALSRGLIKYSDPSFDWLGSWAFQRRRYFGKNSGPLLVSIAFQGFYRGEDENTISSIINVLETNRLRHQFLAAVFFDAPALTKKILGEPGSQSWLNFWDSMLRWERCPIDLQEVFYRSCEVELPPHLLDLVGNLIGATLPDSWVEQDRLPEHVRRSLEPPGN